MYNLTQTTMTMDYNVTPAQSAGMRELSLDEVEGVNGAILPIIAGFIIRRLILSAIANAIVGVEEAH
jgi:hypothetical protein